MDAGLPRRAPPVDRRDQRPGRRRAAGGPARRAAPRGAARALPAGPGLARGQRARLRGGLRGRRVAGARSRSGSGAPTTPCCGPTASGSSARPSPGPRPPPRPVPEIDYVARGGERAPLRTALKEDQIVWARAPGAVRPRRRLDRHAALHAARGRPGREPRGGPQRPAADPGLLPPDGRAPRARPLDRPRLHRDLHPLRGAARLPRPRLPLRAAEGGPVPDGPRRRARPGPGRCRRSSTGSGRASRSRCCAPCRRAPGSARPRSSAG